MDARFRIGARGWSMEGAVSDRVDSAAVERILAVARSATIDALVEEDPGDNLAVYGLDNPLVTISIGDDSVLVGAINGENGGLFVRYASGGAVYLSHPSLASIGLIHPLRVRERRPLLFPYRKIDQLTLSQGGSVRTVRRDGINRWRLVEEGLLADPRAVYTRLVPTLPMTRVRRTPISKSWCALAFTARKPFSPQSSRKVRYTCAPWKQAQPSPSV